jgi:hypothetical protein
MGLYRRDKKVESPTKIIVVDAPVVVKRFVEEGVHETGAGPREDYERRGINLRRWETE